MGQGTRVDGGEEKKGRSGVGIMVKEDLVEELIEVKRLVDRMMKIAMVFGRKILHVFSVHAAQQGRPETEKREFLEKLLYQIIYMMPLRRIF